MSATTPSGSIPRGCAPRRSNGRPRAVRARDASPGSTYKTSRGGSVSLWRSRPPRVDQALEVKSQGSINSVIRKRLIGVLSAAEILRRVDRGRALAHFEVQLRTRDVAGRTGLADDLAALDGLAFLHTQFAGVSIGGDEAIGMPHQHEVAIALEFAARVGDDALLGRLDRGSFRHRDVDAVVLSGARLRAEALALAAAHRPAEAGG